MREKQRVRRTPRHDKSPKTIRTFQAHIIDLSDDDDDTPKAGPSRKRDGSLSSDDEDVVTLNEPPEHLRKVTNEDEPILLSDDSDVKDQPKVKRARLAKRGSTSTSCGSSTSDDSRAGIPELRNESPPLSTPSTIADPSPDASSLAAPSSRLSPRPAPTVGHTSADLLPEILDVLPDIDPEWALDRLRMEADLGKDNVVHSVLQMALEWQGGYPTLLSQKGKAKEQEHKVEYDKDTYRREHRSSPTYREKSLLALQDHFPNMPVSHINHTFVSSGFLYYHAYMTLKEHSGRSIPPFIKLKRLRPSKGILPISGGQAKDQDIVLAESLGTLQDGYKEWLFEHRFLVDKLESERIAAEEAEAKRVAHDAALAEGNGFECGCCFGDELLEDMFQCAEGHLFCKECSTRHAETKLGDQVTVIACMDTSGCPALFPESELRRLLTVKSVNLYFRLKQAAELASAGIDGLESCPACDYAVVIDNPEEKLFFCQSEACSQVSCRKCRQIEHLPKSCEEVANDRKLNKRHLVEDAMSAALIRKCPKCEKPYLKDGGCNKIICNGCGTITCYICQKAITNGYNHFDQTDSSHPEMAGKCRLWDSKEAEKDIEKIVAARGEAQAEARRAAEAEGITLTDDDLDVAAPVTNVRAT